MPTTAAAATATFTFAPLLAQSSDTAPPSIAAPSASAPAVSGGAASGTGASGGATPSTGAATGSGNGASTATPSQNGSAGTDASPTSQSNGGLFGGSGFLILILVLVVMWVFLIGGQRKEKKKRAQLIQNLAKGARIQTIGGILGTVVEVRDEEVVVKVDENANTRLRFAKSAIQNVFTAE